jgi:hypothetical protein
MAVFNLIMEDEVTRKQSPTNELPWYSECMFTKILDRPMIDLMMSITWKSPSIKRG